MSFDHTYFFGDPSIAMYHENPQVEFVVQIVLCSVQKLANVLQVK